MATDTERPAMKSGIAIRNMGRNRPGKLCSRGPAPPSPFQNFRNPIHDPRPGPIVAPRGYSMAAEIQLLACGYSAQCTVRGCGARGTVLARYTDDQGRPLKQRELCDRHADWAQGQSQERP